eukprot:1323184-Rhodomonas_salina.2
MTAILVLLYAGSPSQLASGIVTSFISLVAFLFLKPYQDPELDFLQTSTLIAQHTTLLCASSFPDDPSATSMRSPCCLS